MAVGTCPFVRARERRAALGWELAVCTAVGQQAGKWGAVSIKATLQLLRKAEEAAGMVAVCRGEGSRVTRAGLVHACRPLASELEALPSEDP